MSKLFSIDWWTQQIMGQSRARWQAHETYLEGCGDVTESILPGRTGRIWLHGVYWYACTPSPMLRVIPVGSKVSVLDRQGLTLLVQLVQLPAQPVATPQLKVLPVLQKSFADAA